MHFDDQMIVLEKWDPKKPISVIYWEGEKERFYLKRFLIENPDKEEKIITDHPKSYLEKVFTDYRPVAEILFAKKRGQERQENLQINIEEFIGIKGITAMGNQLTKEKVLEINALDPLPYNMPEQKSTSEIEVEITEQIPENNAENREEKEIPDDKDDSSDDLKTDETGQGLLF